MADLVERQLRKALIGCSSGEIEDAQKYLPIEHL